MTNPSAAGPRIIAFRSPATVFRWIARHKEFRDEYTLACELRAEDLAEEMIDEGNRA
jgi:hypothetical protein